MSAPLVQGYPQTGDCTPGAFPSPRDVVFGEVARLFCHKPSRLRARRCRLHYGVGVTLRNTFPTSIASSSVPCRNMRRGRCATEIPQASHMSSPSMPTSRFLLIIFSTASGFGRMPSFSLTISPVIRHSDSKADGSAPEVLKPIRSQLGITHSVLDVLVAEPGL